VLIQRAKLNRRADSVHILSPPALTVVRNSFTANLHEKSLPARPKGIDETTVRP